MSRRFAVGLGAWLLGVGIATTGSMIAVHELAHGLLVSQAQQLGAGATPAGLTAGSASPTASPSASASATRRHLSRHSPPASADPPTQAGTLLDSGDGSVIATCEAGGAYLLSWFPDQGFWAEDVARGPAAVAKVTFRGPGGGVLVSVSCPAGSPVAHLRQLSGWDADDSPSPGPSGSPTDE